MKVAKITLLFLLTFIPSACVVGKEMPHFKDYTVFISPGPFAKKIIFSNEQKNNSSKWKIIMQRELMKVVNFSGHYVVYISRKGEFPEECGNNGWVCGWIIDKNSGRVVSELPSFNGNTRYFSTIDNGTPSPDQFNIEFYAKSSMLWISGQNIPVNGSANEVRCANTAYNFNMDSFVKLFSGKCEVDTGNDVNADRYLPE